MADRVASKLTKLRRLCGGLVRFTESDAPIVPFVCAADARLDEVEPLLRAVGLFAPASDAEVESFFARVQGDTSSVLRVLSSMAEPAWEWLRVSTSDLWPVVCVSGRAEDSFVAMVPTVEFDDMEFAADSWRAPAGTEGGEGARQLAKAIAAATRGLVVVPTFAPEEERWAVETGATRADALGRAVAAARYVRTGSFSPFERQGSRYPEAAALNARFAELEGVVRHHCGFRAHYAEISVGRDADGDWVGVHTAVTWT